MWEMAQQSINGLTLGAMLALVALGYTMVYGILELINFAHGEIFMCGSFFGLYGLTKALSWGLPTWLALVAAMVFAMAMTGLMGVLIERVAYRPLRGAPRLCALISAIGVSLFLMNFVMLFVAGDARTYPKVFGPAWQVGKLYFRQEDLLVVVVTALVLAGLLALIYRTKLGRAMRCIAMDMDAARLMGIPVNRIIALTFFVGSALAATGGMLNGMANTTVKYDMGFVMGIKAFTAAVLGGIGNVKGALLGGLLLGLSQTLLTGFLAHYQGDEVFNYQDAVSFGVLVLVLMFRPSGLLGENVQQKA